MHIRYANIVNLCEKLSYMLICCFSVVTGKLGKVGNSETPWIRYRVKILGVRFFIGLSHPFGVNPNSLRVRAI
jgi:hypothetical protein